MILTTIQRGLIDDSKMIYFYITDSCCCVVVKMCNLNILKKIPRIYNIVIKGVGNKNQ